MIKYSTLFSGMLLLFSCSEPSKEIPVQEKDFCSSIHRNDSLSVTHELEPFTDSMVTKTGVYVLEDGGGSLNSK